MSTTAPDDRLTAYAPTVATTQFAVDFPLFDDDDLVVLHNSTYRTDFTVSATFVNGVAIDAKVIFATGLTGSVWVVGYRAPRQTVQFEEGRPIPTKDQNLRFHLLEAEMQEVRRDVDRAHKAAYGNAGDIFEANEVRNAQQYAQQAAAVAAAVEASGAPAFTLSSKVFAEAGFHPSVAPAWLATMGYASAADLGGALYKKVNSQPSHQGKLSITLSGGGVVWYEIAVPKVNVRQFGAVGDGAVDDRAACQAAVDYLVSKGGGDCEFPTGTYRLVGAANADGLANGIVIPFSSFVVSNRIRLVSTGKATLKAASNNMVVVRMSQPGSELIGLEIDGGYDYSAPGTSLSGTWGIGFIPENRNQTNTLVSQSFCKVEECYVRNCIEGLVVEPGPTVLGSQSGAFYPTIVKNDFNLNRRSMWFKPALNDGTNRPTRANIAFNRIERGNCGVDLEYATEFNLIGNNYQFFKSTYDITPISTACAIHIGALSEGINILGGEAEQCDNDIFNEATTASAVRVTLGFSLGGVNTGMGFSPVHQPHLLRLTRQQAPYEQLSVTAHQTGFARLVFDYGAANIRDANIEVNSIRRASWGSSNNLYMNTTHQFFLSDGTTPTGIITSNRIAPGADNVQSGGLASQRYTQLFAATATIGTSDAREKDWRGALTDAELRVAKRVSKLVGLYRWKEAVASKGDAARLHVGVTVQAVMAEFEAEGLDPFAYGMICYDEWEDEFTEELETFEATDPATGETVTGQRVKIDADGNPVMRQTVTAGNRYGIRYEELSAFIAAGRQDADDASEKRISQLEALVGALASRIAALEGD